MNRPSEDQRGDLVRSDPGRVDILWLARSRIRVPWTRNEFPPSPATKTILLPSGPIRIALRLVVFRENRPRRTALRGNDVAFRAALRIRRLKQDLGAVGRPAGQCGIRGWSGQLHGAASIPVDPPQDAVGKSYIRHRFTVRRESEEFGGDASEIGLELMGLQVIANQLAAKDDAPDKYLLPVLAGIRSIPADWA